MSAAPDTRQGCYTIQNTGLGLQSRHTSYNKECLNLKIGDVRVWSFLHIILPLSAPEDLNASIFSVSG